MYCRNWKIASVLVLSVVLLASGCTMRVVKKDMIAEGQAEENRGKGFEDGFERGREYGKKEAQEKYAKSLNDMKSYLLYYALKEEDLVVPPKIQRIFVGGSSTGTHFQPPRVEYVITEQAHFNASEMNEFASKAEWGWILLQEYASAMEAMKAVSSVQKRNDQDFVDVLSRGEGGSGAALMVRVRQTDMSSAYPHYKKQFSSAQITQ